MPAPETAPADRPLVVGWKEWVGLPELGITRLKAKVDTGARTSSLHVASLDVVERLADGTELADLEVALGRRGAERRLTARAQILRRARVTDSGGHAEVRPVIETLLEVGRVRKRILLTLTDRGGMLFRMILGRKALEDDFLVDVSRKYLLGRRRTVAVTPAGDAPGAPPPDGAGGG
jgi:hypothetical protein